MKIDFAKIENLTRPEGTLHDIEGTIGGHKIQVSRRLDGWTPRLVITIDGVRVHDAEPSEEERMQFVKLKQRAMDAHSDKMEAIRAGIINSEAFAAIFGKGGK